MKKGIDFLKAYEKVGPPKKLSRAFALGMIVSVVFYSLLAAGTISFWLYLKKEHQQISRQIEVKKSQISKLQKKESLQVLLKQRLSSLAKLRPSKGGDFPRLLSFFLQFSEEGVNFKEIKVSDGGEVEISGTASNAFSFARFLEKMTSADEAKIFSKITLTSVTRQKDGSYNFSLSLNYEKT